MVFEGKFKSWGKNCDIYRSSFARKSNLKAVHGRKKPFKFDTCSVILSQKDELEVYLASVHERKKQCFPTFWEDISFSKLINKPRSSKIFYKYLILLFDSKFCFTGPLNDGKNTWYYWWLDSPFARWYWLLYQLKVLANLGYGFGIGPKPKLWLRFQ